MEAEPVHSYSDNWVSAILGTIATTLAFALTTLPIFALYHVASPMGRTGIVIAFTFVFSVTVSMMTRARRIEYFAATVGFCAVLAAIIGNNDGMVGNH
jgi:predicted membrane-bound spermidine synthase